MDDLLRSAAERGIRYRNQLNDRPVYPLPESLARLAQLDQNLPQSPTNADEVLAILDDIGSPATVASAGRRYFGFVIGSSLPVTVAASWLAGAWDQIAGLVVTSPVNAALEKIALRWCLDLLKLPSQCGGGFVTCATAANFCGLAAARHALLARIGWDVEARGLFEAPPITVVVGEEVHASINKALSMVGLGRDRVVRVPVDDQGRMRTDVLPNISGPTIVCLQAGNVNTGAFDPIQEICTTARAADAWVHIDGAFGLWASASPRLAHFIRGVELADSWAIDAHKWLNVPYDCGMIFARDSASLRSAMSTSGSYLMQDEERIPYQYTPDFSRRARGIEVWAALRCLGRDGLADLIERTCRLAVRFAEGLRGAGYHVLNDIVLNQVLVSFGQPEHTKRVIARVQADGTCWCGGTVWQGHTAMRISVSSWSTTEEDVDRSLAAILRAAQE
jgi:glutamate/tyrosine decarboxylase-like PLP-dependent enzyme